MGDFIPPGHGEPASPPPQLVCRVCKTILQNVRPGATLRIPERDFKPTTAWIGWCESHGTVYGIYRNDAA